LVAFQSVVPNYAVVRRYYWLARIKRAHSAILPLLRTTFWLLEGSPTDELSAGIFVFQIVGLLCVALYPRTHRLSLSYPALAALCALFLSQTYYTYHMPFSLVEGLKSTASFGRLLILTIPASHGTWQGLVTACQGMFVLTFSITVSWDGGKSYRLWSDALIVLGKKVVFDQENHFVPLCVLARTLPLDCCKVYWFGFGIRNSSRYLEARDG
jgi:hypothetical protein